MEGQRPPTEEHNVLKSTQRMKGDKRCCLVPQPITQGMVKEGQVEAEPLSWVAMKPCWA